MNVKQDELINKSSERKKTELNSENQLSIDTPKLSTWITYGGNVLWIPVIALTGFGILFVYSSSSVYSSQHFGTEFYYAKRQAMYLVPAIAAAIIGAKVPFEQFYKYIRYLFFTFILLTFATHLPYVGKTVSGASRWIALGPLPAVQPSEFLKIFTIMFLTWIFTSKPGEYIKNEPTRLKNIVEFFILLIAPLAIISQKDFGSTVVVISGIVAILFMNGLPKRYFVGIFSIIISGLTTAILIEPYRISRIMTFLDPFKDPLGSGFQVIQSFVAVANGGLFGRGIGESQQKLFFLPEAHTDFILAVITEEMGFIGILVLAILYSVLYYAILRLVIYGKNHRDRLLATGAFAMLVTTTIINMGVVAGALPNKGLPLPFISNGGTALVANFFIIGLLSQISRRIYTDSN